MKLITRLACFLLLCIGSLLAEDPKKYTFDINATSKLEVSVPGEGQQGTFTLTLQEPNRKREIIGASNKTLLSLFLDEDLSLGELTQVTRFKFILGGGKPKLYGEKIQLAPDESLCGMLSHIEGQLTEDFRFAVGPAFSSISQLAAILEVNSEIDFLSKDMKANLQALLIFPFENIVDLTQDKRIRATHASEKSISELLEKLQKKGHIASYKALETTPLTFSVRGYTSVLDRLGKFTSQSDDSFPFITKVIRARTRSSERVLTGATEVMEKNGIIWILEPNLAECEVIGPEGAIDYLQKLAGDD